MFWLKAPPAGWKMPPGRCKMITMPEKLEEIQLQTRNVSLQSRVFPCFHAVFVQFNSLKTKCTRFRLLRANCAVICAILCCASTTDHIFHQKTGKK